jgi:hypothetical protein
VAAARTGSWLMDRAGSWRMGSLARTTTRRRGDTTHGMGPGIDASAAGSGYVSALGAAPNAGRLGPTTAERGWRGSVATRPARGIAVEPRRFSAPAAPAAPPIPAPPSGCGLAAAGGTRSRPAFHVGPSAGPAQRAAIGLESATVWLGQPATL